MTEKGAERWRIMKIVTTISSFIGVIVAIWVVFVPVYEASQEINKIPQLERQIIHLDSLMDDAEVYRLEQKIIWDEMTRMQEEMNEDRERGQRDSADLDLVFDELNALWDLIDGNQ